MKTLQLLVSCCIVLQALTVAANIGFYRLFIGYSNSATHIVVNINLVGGAMQIHCKLNKDYVDHVKDHVWSS